MDVSPMSMQMVVPRATDAGQMQHNMNQAAALQHDFETMRNAADVELKLKQVRTKDETEDGRIKDDPERNRGGGFYGGRRQKQSAAIQEETEEEPAQEKFAFDPRRGRHLDISL